MDDWFLKPTEFPPMEAGNGSGTDNQDNLASGNVLPQNSTKRGNEHLGNTGSTPPSKGHQPSPSPPGTGGQVENNITDPPKEQDVKDNNT